MYPSLDLRSLADPQSFVPFRLVVVVASEGGLEALSRLLSQLPPTFGVAIAIVQHRSTGSPELLAKILQQQTTLRLRNVQDDDEVRPGVVYIAPPGIHVLVGADGRFALREGAKVKYVRPSGDVFFSSAAEAFGRQLIAVVLTGGDGDGSGGIGIVKRHGGTVISQNEETARAPSMPRSAIETGNVDYVLPLDEIAGALDALATRGATLAAPRGVVSVA